MLAVACASGRERADPAELARPTGKDSGTHDDGGIDVPKVECGSDFCGDTFLHEVQDPPNLYFLVDRSGSMDAIPAGSTRTKYDLARRVLGELMRVIGHRVRYGASVFPATASTDSCGPGREVFVPTVGGMPSCTDDLDPVLGEFLDVFRYYKPGGATPTSAALAELRPALEALDGDTFLVLITDGAPNCNLEASCGIDECMPNIEGARVGNTSCTGDVNCCDPDLFGELAPGNCVDLAASEREVLELAEHGIPTYVIGMPGAEPYAAVLDRLARAGGTARSGKTAYYAVSDQGELKEALYSIGTGVAIRCSIELDAPPEDLDRVNVYFDGNVVPRDDEDGWSWDGPRRIEVHGAACDELSSGAVIDARAVFGCDSVVR